MSIKSVFNSAINKPEEKKEFIEAVGTIANMFHRLEYELPLYKLYHNKLARDFLNAAQVGVIHSKKVIFYSCIMPFRLF